MKKRKSRHKPIKIKPAPQVEPAPAAQGDEVKENDCEPIALDAGVLIIDPSKPLSLYPLTLDQAVAIALSAPPMPKRIKKPAE